VFDRFTGLAKRAVVASQDAALSLGTDFIGTEHVLLGLAVTAGGAGEVLRERGVEVERLRDETSRQLAAAGIVPDGGSGAREALSTLGIDLAEIQRRADEAFGPGAFQFPRPAYTARAKRVLEGAVREAAARSQEQIDTEHVLLSLLGETEGLGFIVLTKLGVDTDGLHAALLERMAPPSAV
jgi:ATP-dependent Clp protease ATP-binding subunit ClpA